MLRATTDPSQVKRIICAVCKKTVPHKPLIVVIDGKEVKAWIAVKGHLADCGLRCSHDGTARPPEKGEHGFKGECPKCRVLKNG